MIGEVYFTRDGEPLVATLGDDGRWACPGWPEIARALDVAFDATECRAADGQPGVRQLREAAEYLGGEARPAHPPATLPDGATP